MTGAGKVHIKQEQFENYQMGLDNVEARLQVPVDKTWPSIQRSEEDDLQSLSDSHSILVLVSKRCLTRASAVDGPHFLRINDERGSFAMFLRENLFGMSRPCKFCTKPGDAHVHCYIHRKGKLTISVERVEMPLSSEKDGRLWMWHSCGKCPLIDGGSPTTSRILMLEADWSLSFRKFLELSFSTDEKSTRLAACGHSLGKDCIRFYGCGNMVACFQFAEISVLSIYLPPLKLELNRAEDFKWLQVEVKEVTKQGDTVFAEVVQNLQALQQQLISGRRFPGRINVFEAKQRILSLEQRLLIEKKIFQEGLTRAVSTYESGHTFADILELNWLRRQLFNYAVLWMRRLEFLRSKVLCSDQLRTDSDDGDTSATLLKEINTKNSNATLLDDLKSEDDLSRRIDNIQASHSVLLNFVQSNQHKQVLQKGDKTPEETSCRDQDANTNLNNSRHNTSKFLEAPDANGVTPQSAREIDLLLCYGKPLDQVESAHQTLGGYGSSSASLSASERLTGLASFVDRDEEGRIKSCDSVEDSSSLDFDGSRTTPTTPLEEHVTAFRSLSEGNVPLLADLANAGDVPWTEDGQSAGTDGRDKLTKDCTEFSLTREGRDSFSEGSTRKLGRFDYSSSSLAQGDNSASTEDAISNTKPRSTETPTQSGDSEDKTVEGWMKALFEKLFKSNRRASSLSMATDPEEIVFPPKHSSILLRAAALAGDGGPRVFLSGGHDDFVVAVYDDEPTTIIAYALTTEEHHVHVTYISEKDRIERDDTEGSDHFRPDQAEAVAHPIQRTESFAEVDSVASTGSFSSDGASLPRVESIESLLISKESSEAAKIAISFTDETPQGNANFQVICYFAKQFDELRKKCCMGNKDYIRSLCRCKKWDAPGGKSKAFFAMTADGRYIVKQLTRTELTSFVNLASSYFKYLFDVLTAGNPTCLAKILGVYEVKIVKDGKETKMDVLVMENLLYGRHVSRMYDLKGSMRSRYNADTGKDQVLLDENLVEILRTNPIYIGNSAKRSLEGAIWNDTCFLAQANVMDYSLLVGVDEERKELVVGIIDFVRKYTWDKQLENWVKATGILGGPKNATPTVVSPKEYKKRFRKAIATYFLMVPDDWTAPPDITLTSSTKSALTDNDVQDDVDPPGVVYSQ